VSDLDFSVIVPVYEEGAAIVGCLDEIFAHLPERAEVVVVFDIATDPTVPYLEAYAGHEPRLRPTLNTFGRGPANALRFGLDTAEGPIAVVTMGDGSDDPAQIPRLAELVRTGAAVAAASRYVKGGRQEGGPLAKRTLSRLVGLSLHTLAGVPIHDVTSAFKAYSTDFVRSVGVQSTEGFEMSLELVAKAHRLRLPIAEIPTVWRDRSQGTSHFHVMRWAPHYLRWYTFAFGRRLTLEKLRDRTGGSAA
jgi:dolichol-phosphate mannosyltransferase